GQPASLGEETFEAGLLEYPQYTRPRDWEGRPIPDVLLSGDHARVARWRRAQAELPPRSRRLCCVPPPRAPRGAAPRRRSAAPGGGAPPSGPAPAASRSSPRALQLD